MKSSAKIFYGITVFLVVMAILYILATHHIHDTGSIQGLEWAGATGLVVSSLLTLFLGAYFHITERHADILPSDWEEAEQADGAGELGFFSPFSVWPLAMTGGIAVLGYGIVFMSYWMIVLGAVILVWATIMLNIQYISGPEKH